MFISLLFRMTEAAGISGPKLTMTIFLGQVVTTEKLEVKVELLNILCVCYVMLIRDG